jgi:solute carrier family 25 protein 34/35
MSVSGRTSLIRNLQAYSPALPVGAQHYYKNSFQALSTIFNAERFRGLLRGSDAAILRTATGSSVQLPSYNFTKEQMVTHGLSQADSIWTYLASSTVSGICVVCPMSSSFATLLLTLNALSVSLCSQPIL